MRVLIFVKKNCPFCAPAKALYPELDVKLPSDVFPVIFDIDSDPGGLALFQFYELTETPTVVITDKSNDKIYRSWSGPEVPTTKEIIREVARAL